MGISYKIEIINTISNAPYYIFSSEVQNNPITSFDFELTYEGGCGGAEIKLAKRLPLKNQIELMSRVNIYMQNDATPWWTGYVYELTHWASTDIETVIKCKGYSALLERLIEENTSYPTGSDTKTGYIIDEFADKLTGISPIKYNSSKIPLTTDGAATRGVNFKNGQVTYKSIFDQLATAHGRYVWGVDESGEFYCKAPIVSTTTPILTLVAGIDIFDFKIKRSLDRRYNELYVHYGNATSQYVKKSSILSQTDLNQKLATSISAPSLTQAADADNWATNKLNDALEPLESVSVNLVNPAQKLFPYGNVRIIPERKASGDLMERIVYEDVVPNNLSSMVSSNYTQIDTNTERYVALLKFNTGKFLYADNAFFSLARPKNQDEVVIEFQIWTDDGGSPGKPVVEIPTTNYNASTTQRQMEMYHISNLKLVGPFIFNATLSQNTNYWIVYKFISKHNGGNATPRWGHDGVNSGSTKIWTSADGITWTAKNNYTTIHRILGEARREGFLQLPLKSIKYKVSSNISCTLGLGDVAEPAPAKIMQLLTNKIKDLSALQSMWS